MTNLQLAGAVLGSDAQNSVLADGKLSHVVRPCSAKIEFCTSEPFARGLKLHWELAHLERMRHNQRLRARLPTVTYLLLQPKEISHHDASYPDEFFADRGSCVGRRLVG